jgi:EAL domain-containing protein (putative c-di-GMP-specific phosphodiesterase class I)/FixJ family two-component response regulator
MTDGLSRWPSPGGDQSGAAPAAGGEAYFLDSHTPLCFIVDKEESHRHYMSLALQSHGIETTLFSKAYVLREGLSRRTPDLIFLDVSASSTDAIDSLRALEERSYRGLVQLMSADGTAGSVKDHCERSTLRILPPLQKPADRAALKRIVQEHKLDSSPTALERTSLDEALKRNWVEFWYQPKIDLRKKQLSGVELFARVRHPERGIMLPGAFMDDADEGSLVGLTELSLVNALKVGLAFSKLGISFRLAVNVSIAALMKLHIPQIVREYRPESGSWPGLLLDITEDQIATDLAAFRELSTQLEPCNIKLAIDDFGRGYLPLGRLKEVPFTELKLDRSFVADCATDKTHAAICRSVIDLSHNFNATAVAVGVEKPADAHTLFRMGCDLGQGYLFAQPMAQERFLVLLRQRAAMTRTRPPVAVPA